MVFKMGLFGKGMYYRNDICLKNYRELHEAMDCFYKALELEEFGACKNRKFSRLRSSASQTSKSEISKADKASICRSENQRFSKASQIHRISGHRNEVSKALELEELRSGKLEDFKLNPEFDEICFYKNNGPVEPNGYQKTLEYHEKFLEINSGDAETWYNRGLVLKNLGRLHEALKSFDRSLEIDPNNVEVWYNKGDTLIDIYFLKGSVRSNYY